MNIIFLTLSRVDNITNRDIYTDLMRKFHNEGHQVYIVSPSERRMGLKTSLMEYEGVHILNVWTLNIQKTNILEKGIGTLVLEHQYRHAIRKYLKGVKFDLILYSTPPITFTNVVTCLKQKNPEAVSYLLLKDIFPQNAIDIGLFSKKSFIYHYFRHKEKALYKASDYIGCMSPANVEYLHLHNRFYQKWRIEVAPNSIELRDERLRVGELSSGMGREVRDRNAIREKYGLPTDKPVFIYGGNLGKPQGIDYLIRCLDDNKYRKDCFFLIVGSGTEYHRLASWLEEQERVKDDTRSMSVKLMKGLPKEEYDQLVQSCDVGLIFLDYRFTIPNYPSRLLSYLENKMPVICATDVNTDIGRIAEQNGYGYWCQSINPLHFSVLVNRFLAEPERIKTMGERGYKYLMMHYLVDHTYQVIMNHFKTKTE